MTEKYTALKERLEEATTLNSVAGLLGWDQQVNMPKGGVTNRARQMGTIVKLLYDRFLNDEVWQLIEDAEKEVDPDSIEGAMVRVARNDYEDQAKLPVEFAMAQRQLEVESHEVWAKARTNNDFKSFQPMLEKVMEMKLQEAEYRGYEEHPYDALLNQYERGMTTAEVKRIFDGHKQALVDLIAAIGDVEDRVSDAPVNQFFPQDKQREFGLWAIKAFGFDFERGRQDIAVHPFAQGMARGDVRITTRFEDNFLNPALFGLMHEAGHGMYEQGVAESIDGTPLGTGTSLGVHESQSRMWENLVGRSRGFWEWAYPELQKTFPEQLKGVSVEDFYKAVNRVHRQFIRVEADEATYNLHIMLRFDIETQLLTGKLKVAELPEIWNAKFEEYLGLVPPTDTLGVLQDVHWSEGLVGYFPTYALGNLLSVQYYNQALKDRPSITDDIANGNFSTLLTWLNENIHQHGRRYNPADLTQLVCGEPITSQPYITYLQEKFTDIYGL